jgi:hypothetical protein
MSLQAAGEALFKKYHDNLSLSKDKSKVKVFDRALSPLGLKTYANVEYLQSFNVFATDETYSQLYSFLLEKLIAERVTTIDPKLQTFQIARDILTGEHHVIEDGGLMPYNYEAWKASIPDQQYELLYEQRIQIVAAFNPHKGLSWEEYVKTPTEEKLYPHYNSYIPAPWTRVEPPTDYTVVTRDIPEFLEHFIPDPVERDYAIWWLYKLSHGRCQDVLVLIGTQGNGKNTFMQLASIIAGEHNSMGAAKSFGKEKFNSEVRRRKLLCLDEYSLSIEHKDAIKCWCNNKITVEMKGGDPVAMLNHCSFILAHNRDKSCNLEFKDRRFTAPTLAKKDLFFVWSPERIERLAETIENSDEFKLAFPHWIRKYVEDNGIEFPLSRCLVTDRFHDLVETSKPRWFKVFKKKLKSQESVNASDIYKAVRMRIDEDTIIDRLRDEEEERRMRGIEPHVIAEVYEDGGKINFKSKIRGAE